MTHTPSHTPSPLALSFRHVWHTMKLRVAGSFFTGSMGAAPKGRGVRWSIQLMLGKWMRFSGCSKRQQIKGTRRPFLFSGKFIISVRAWPRMHQWH